jgi:hypothetical protein
MLAATTGIPDQDAPLFKNVYVLCNSTVERLGASDRLGRIKTSSKSNLGSLSIRNVIPFFDREIRGPGRRA